jgi:hypothetical protein
MERQGRPRAEKWVIIPLEVGADQVVQIDYRIPANVFHCTGVLVSISGVYGYYIQTTLGELSLSYNNRASQPVCLPGNWIPFRKRLDHILYKLEEPLEGGTRVTGYYKNIVQLPYTVQIYLQCISNR